LPEIPAIRRRRLGSGLGDFAELARRRGRHPVASCRTGRRRGSSGTRASWWSTSGGRTIAALAGRVHLYEGHDARTVTFATRVLGRLGVKTLILTNAAGGVNTGFAQGALMVIDDHLNLTGSNPLVGDNDERFGHRFPDMTEVYSSRLRGIADRAGKAINLMLPHGIYVGLLGPSYETPAEIRYLRRLAPTPSGCPPCLSDRGPSYEHGRPRHFVHHQYGGRRSAGAARSRRGDGDRAPSAGSSSRWRGSLTDLTTGGCRCSSSISAGTRVRVRHAHHAFHALLLHKNAADILI
jgi:inosine/guanosine/xanthosine phosphorylase family protein